MLDGRMTAAKTAFVFALTCFATSANAFSQQCFYGFYSGAPLSPTLWQTAGASASEVFIFGTLQMVNYETLSGTSTTIGGEVFDFPLPGYSAIEHDVVLVNVPTPGDWILAARAHMYGIVFGMSAMFPNPPSVCEENGWVGVV